MSGRDCITDAYIGPFSTDPRADQAHTLDAVITHLGMPQIIFIHPEAPAKPARGDACNGCGVCCLAEPCPVGMLVSLKRVGACAALRRDTAQQRYRCGMMATRTGWWSDLLRRLMKRYIAAGAGCDADAQAVGSLDSELRR